MYMLIDTIIEQLRTKASEINRCSEGSIWVSINDGKITCLTVTNDLPSSHKEIPLITTFHGNKSQQTDLTNDEPEDLSEISFEKNIISKDPLEQEELKQKEQKRTQKILENKGILWKNLTPHLLNIKRNQALAILLKMAGIPGDVSAKFLGLKNYKGFQELLYGRRGKDPRGGAIKALWKSASKSPDLSGCISSQDFFISHFKTFSKKRYSNFQQKILTQNVTPVLTISERKQKK